MNTPEYVIDATPAAGLAGTAGGTLVIDTESTAGPDMNQAQELSPLEQMERRAQQMRVVRRMITLAKREQVRKPMKAKRKAKNRAANKVARKSRKRNK